MKKSILAIVLAALFLIVGCGGMGGSDNQSDGLLANVQATATATEITVTKVEGAQYRLNDGQWQAENVFTDLTPDTEYTVEVQINVGKDNEEHIRKTVKTASKEAETETGDFTFVEDGDITLSYDARKNILNLVTATDDYGRTAGPAAAEETEQYVGMFYFLWHGQHGGQQNGIYDNSKFLNENPEELFNINSKLSPAMKYHYWGEPLYGYYNSCDPWVIRRQIELFVYAGIDFLGFDATNAFEYLEVMEVILPIMQEYYDLGWDVPKIMFYCNSYSNNSVRHLYSGFTEEEDPNATGLKRTGIYKQGLYKDLWFRPNGDKPFIVAPTKKTNMSPGNTENSHVTNPELLNFFDFRESQWPIGTPHDLQDGFPWISFDRPQTVYTDAVNVSIAQHQKLPFSDGYYSQWKTGSERLATEMWGRGYSAQNAKNKTTREIDSIRRGDNFQEEWDFAKQADVKYTFVTGWNEWTALKSIGNPGNNNYAGIGKEPRAFWVDTFNEEFSRDIEMMKDGYKDNPYIQLATNIRDHKYSAAEKTINDYSSIDVKKGMAQWNSVSAIYANFANKGNRDFTNMARDYQYTDNSLINDIAEIRVAHDAENIYFLITCTNDIDINFTSEKFMNIMIDVEGAQGDSFEGYDYTINRKPRKTGYTTVEKNNYNRGQFHYEETGRAQFTVGGKYMQVKVPKSALGIDGSFTINFKVTDNVVAETGDMQAYYISGCAAPVGRWNYTFSGK